MVTKKDIDKFINDLLIFVEEDYLYPAHNFNQDLKYSVKEMDEHYGSDYRYLFDLYYENFCKFKNEGCYPTISISYDCVKDDYFILVSLEQMNGAAKRKEIRKKEFDKLLEKEMKLVEEGRLDEVSPATLWLIGKL